MSKTVFIHGFSSSLYTWRQCLAPIAGKYRVVALDLKGFGFTGKPSSEYTTDEYVDFLIHFMDALGLQTATLCGNSMGGNIAWRSALKYPERVDKLILVDAAGYEEKHAGMPAFLKLSSLPGVGELLSVALTRGRIRSLLESAYFDPARVTEQTVSAYYYPMKTEGAMRAVLARLRDGRSDTAQWQSKIPEIHAPTLIIWGANDKWIEKENAIKFHTDIRGSALVIIPECGHVP
ncbi:MAG: alpha/beta hydrolase [Candidatus Lindowbacteria bacterium]|nr:alpha/beta hydrolase [Candidatus Lindowbacteria bacterium]